MTDLRGPVAAGLLTAAATTAVIVWGVRRLAGPVFAHELTVLARRGDQPRLRAGLVVVLLLVLLLTYAARFGWDAVGGETPTVDPRSSQFAETFAVTTLAVQLLAVVVLTPAVVGSAITEERERGTLDLLRTTALSDREIVVGKLLARLAVVGGVVAAGLPVLALTLLFGGVDPTRLLVIYAVTAVTAFGLGAVSVALGTVKDSLRAVLATTYGGVGLLTLLGGCTWLVPGLGGVSPASLFAVVLAEDDPRLRFAPVGRYWWVSFVVFGVLYGGGGLYSVWLAVGRLRASTVRRTDDPAAERAVRRGFYAHALGWDENPLVWQERVFGGRRFGGDGVRLAFGALVLFVVGAGLFVGVVASAERFVWIGGAVGSVVRPVLAAAAVFLPLALGLRLAAAVAGERERQSLDALLMLPDDRRGVLRAKAVATALWARGSLGVVAGAWAGAVLLGGIGVVAGLLCVCHLGAAVTAAVGFAGWLSVRQRTGARATVLFLTGLLTVNVLPLLVAPLANLVGPDTGGAVRAVSPPVAVWVSGREASWVAVVALGPAAGFAAVGWWLWRAAERRLDAGS